MGAIFTTIRVCAGRIWFADDHWERLGVDLGAGVLAVSAGREDVRVRVTVASDSEPVFEAQAYTAPETPWVLAPVTVSPDGDSMRKKTTNRGYYDRARARAGDVDDALLMRADGTLLECTIANVFLHCGGQWKTPPATEPLLPGIARKRLLAANLDAVESPLTLQDLRMADAAVVTNALVIAHPVSAIEGVVQLESARLARHLKDAVQP